MTHRGQALTETVCGLSIMLLIGVAGFTLLVHALGSLILAKWASETSHCVAQGITKTECVHKTENTLIHHFAFKKVNVKVKPWQGIIHTEIDARILGNALIQASYDLEPSEYKRDPE